MRRAGWTDNDFDRIAELGYSLHRQGRYTEAAMIFDGLVAVDPGNAYCRDALAAAWLALGQPKRAIEQLSLLLSRDPGHMAARSRRFEAFLESGDFNAARDEFNVLKQLLPAHEVSRLGLRFEASIRDATLLPDLR